MTCIVVVNVFNQSAKNLVSDIELFLSSRGYDVILVNFNGDNKPFPNVKFDFAVSLGGDGTVLYVSRQCMHTKKPIFPINFGEFGFIAGIKPEQWKKSLADFLENKLLPTKRTALYVEVFRNKKKIYKGHALNEVVLTSKKSMKTISLDVDAGDTHFGKFKGDGLILATPTGSTAYSVAAGGPIVDPTLDAIVFTPVSPFSLSTRSLVLSGKTVLTIKVMPSRNLDFMVSCDGQVYTDIEIGDIIIVKQSTSKCLLVGCDSQVFYSALRSKFHWSGGPFA